MDIVSRLLTRSNLEWASLFVGFAIIWMISGFFVQEPSPPALIEKKDPVVRVIDQKAENFSKEIVVKGFTKADKKVLVKSETSGKIIDLPIAQGTFVKKGEVICSLFVAERQANFDKALLDFNWSHPFVYHAGAKVGWYRLKTESEFDIKKEFIDAYEEILEESEFKESLLLLPVFKEEISVEKPLSKGKQKARLENIKKKYL